MNTQASSLKPLFAGRSFRVDYGELSAHNTYADDGQSIRYAIVSGPYTGASGESQCEWREVSEGLYAISWQESDGATVVHIDDFVNGRSLAFFTASDMKFHRMQGSLTGLESAQAAAPRAGV
jgi:phenolic acid decarboxylase